MKLLMGNKQLLANSPLGHFKNQVSQHNPKVGDDIPRKYPCWEGEVALLWSLPGFLFLL